ncbi:hypothetical protein HBH54_247700 [Parastagonospora nodorum]|nr:hypothetical protein HBH54_247700 [Parastagonospora nodorum]KAH4553374.1 hypothetical protein HBH84_249620 [Parastagonospora nodorum]
MRLKKNVLETRLRIVEIKNYIKRNSTIFITRDYTTIKFTRLSNFYIECIRIANAKRIVRGLENSAPASLLVYSDYALQKCSLLSIVLYNAIKEYYDDRTRKIIYFYSYTIENKCRTSYSNKKDIEANERKFAILAEKYTIDNCIVYALLEDCNALVERYKEEINCSDLYSTI